MRGKKGISEVIAYVLLIVIGLSLALLVANFLRGLLPGEEKTCPDGVAISMVDHTCENKKLEVVLKNNGLFSVKGYVLRAEDAGGLIQNLQGIETRSWLRGGEGVLNYFSGSPEFAPLAPGQLSTELSTQTFDYSNVAGGLKRIEIQPFIVEDGEVVLCDVAIVSYNVDCS